MGEYESGELDLSGLKSVSIGALEAINKYDIAANLSGLEDISPDQAEVIKDCNKSLGVKLDGLKSLDGEAAEIFGKRCFNLSLNGIEDMDAEIVEKIDKA